MTDDNVVTIFPRNLAEASVKLADMRIADLAAIYKACAAMQWALKPFLEGQHGKASWFINIVLDETLQRLQQAIQAELEKRPSDDDHQAAAKAAALLGAYAQEGEFEKANKLLSDVFIARMQDPLPF